MIFIIPAYGGIQFIPNQGQWDNQIKAAADIPGGKLWITDSGLTYLFYDGKKISDIQHRRATDHAVKFHCIKIDLIDADFSSAPHYSEKSSTYYNYYLGSDANRWVSGLYGYRKIIYPNIYPGVDFAIYGYGDAVKYDFIVKAGIDPEIIRMKYRGQDSLAVENAELHLTMSLGKVTEGEPLAWDKISEEQKRMVACRYTLIDDIVFFQLTGHKEKNTLVIDPEVVFSTFSGSVADNFGYTATYDEEGHGYSGGTAFSPGFPVTTGAFQIDYGGGISRNPPGDGARDIGILKYAPDGKQLIYATYLGGFDNEDPHSMVVNPQGELLVFGNSYSENFPVTPDAFDTTWNGEADIIIARFSADGKALLSSTFLGGQGDDALNGSFDNLSHENISILGFNYADIYRGEIITDTIGNVFIITTTKSYDFPVPNGFQTTRAGGLQDACVVKLNADLSDLLWGTYLGGDGDDAGYSINLNSLGHIYVCGGTSSADFPLRGNSLFKTDMGGVDGFISCISPDGSQLIYSTYFGTNDYDQCYFVQIDQDDNVFTTGQTKG
ncbi:MAG: hypothetical protein M3Q97_05100, partial [Bacteroidota bacterium]|nr:hypothetical protein [Bacteroidota bacterium]